MHPVSILLCLVQLLALSKPTTASPKLLPSTLSPNVTRFVVRSLPNVTFRVPPSWAGQIPIPGISDDQLFFWLFQAENHNASQNLISKASFQEGWKTMPNDYLVWLNGGPGCSSLTGLTFENGPLQFHQQTAVPSPNPHSWTKLANVLYIDQPVGTGYSSGNRAASNNTETISQFFHWLKAFYDHFPALKTKNTYVMGESYAGIYIPYFAKALMSNRNILNINLKAIALGDPTIGNNAAMTDLVTTTYLHEISAYYKIPKPILSAFDAADRLCGFDKVMHQLTYPPTGKFTIPGNPEGLNFLKQRKEHAKRKRQPPCPDILDTPSPNNNTTSSPHDNPITIPGCATYTAALSYLPTIHTCFNPYNIHATCRNRDDSTSSGATSWLNHPSVRAAIHAPPEKTIQECNETVFETLSAELVEPPVYRVLPELLGRGLKVHVWSGGWDFLLNHWGTEVVLQNMTWFVAVLFSP
ncbi:MAG: hypothetical protein Q9182_000362 [Xanthomendoza sp. 2 TL-2023]